jgi:hypothetical protein
MMVGSYNKWLSGVVFSQSSLRSHWIAELPRGIGSTRTHEQDDAMNLDFKMKLWKELRSARMRVVWYRRQRACRNNWFQAISFMQRETTVVWKSDLIIDVKKVKWMYWFIESQFSLILPASVNESPPLLSTFLDQIRWNSV